MLDDSGTAAFQRYLDSGGNFIGIHAAADCLVNTSFYGREVGASASPPLTFIVREIMPGPGAYFDSHPPIQDAVRVTLIVFGMAMKTHIGGKTFR